MKYLQYDLDCNGARLTCWLPERLKVGSRLTLKNDVRLWTVTAMYGPERDSPPDKKWEVGGLG